MRPLRGYYWIIRTNASAGWWLLRFDLRTAWRFLRYSLLALQGRLLVVDERIVDTRGGYTFLQLEVSPLPLTSDGELPAASPTGEIPDQPRGGLLFRRSWPL